MNRIVKMKLCALVLVLLTVGCLWMTGCSNFIKDVDTNGPETDPQEITSVETEPEESVTPETEPEETTPPETEPEESVTPETEPEETTPPETEPEETTLPETEPEETTPAETEPEKTTPPETEPEESVTPETEPEETTPPETEPEETTPPETEPEPEPSIGPNTALTYEAYLSMSEAEQMAHYESFLPDYAGFFAWFNQAKAEYDAAQDREEIGGDGSVDLGGRG